MSMTTSSQANENTSPAANANRVWVGNLAYKSSEQDLRDAFAGMKISEVSLPERFGRRQGYAFITFENEEDVDRAVSDINGKELLGREMRVQKATSGGPYATENGDADGKTSAESKKARQRPRSRKLGQTPREGTSEEHTDAAEESADKPSSKPVRPRGRSQKKSGESGEEAETQGERKRSSKRTARKGPPEDGTPSTTTIYVANIPFEYTDDKLKELFSTYQPTSAYIVPRQIPRYIIRKLAERGEARKGRGFGFVTFADEIAQKKAVEEMNGREVDGREISVKVAIDKPREGNEDENEPALTATNGSA